MSDRARRRAVGADPGPGAVASVLDPRLEPVAERLLPARIPESAPWVPGLHPAVVAAFERRGITALWPHQAEALAALLSGGSVVVASPTASGKSLPYLAASLHWIRTEPASTVLYLAPTKSLARDQAAAAEPLLTSALAGLRRRRLEPGCCALDGDSGPAERARARRTGRILFTNPEMLHYRLLPEHPGWHRFFAGLRLVVIDEVHALQGRFGSHVAHVLWRLARLRALHRRTGAAAARAGKPGPAEALQIYACSATLGNPAEFVSRLTGAPVRQVDGPGIRRAALRVALARPRPWRPDPRGAPSERSPEPDAREAEVALPEGAVAPAASLIAVAADQILRFVAPGRPVLVFGRTRAEVERIAGAVSRALQGRRGGVAAGEGTETPGPVAVYRAGLPREERLRVEALLRAGAPAVVVATSALELGVDLSACEVAVMVGYPGSATAFWQRAGRVARRDAPGQVLCILGGGPSDRMAGLCPGWALDPEAARQEYLAADPRDPLIRIAHLGCAAFEAPLSEEALETHPLGPVAGPDLRSALERLGGLREIRGRWHWVGEGSPHRAVSLRGASRPEVAVLREGSAPDARPLDRMGQWEAAARLYPGAVHRVGGAPFEVLRVASRTGTQGPAIAWVRPAPTGRDARPQIEETATALQVWERRSLGSGLEVARVTLRRERVVTGLRRLDSGSAAAAGAEAAAVRSETGEDSPAPEPFRVAQVAEALLVLGVEQMPGFAVAQAARDAGRGPGWRAAREAARARDAFRCRRCGARERPGRAHAVHHIRPFRAFGWVPGQNEAYAEANRLENLVTLCGRCHALVEAELRPWSLPRRVAWLLRGGIARTLLWEEERLFVGLREVGGGLGGAGWAEAEIEPDGTADSEPRARALVVWDRAGGDQSLPVALYDGLEEVARRVLELVGACACPSGCPDCVGVPDEGLAEPKAAVVRVLAALAGARDEARPTGSGAR